MRILSFLIICFLVNIASAKSFKVRVDESLTTAPAPIAVSIGEVSVGEVSEIEFTTSEETVVAKFSEPSVTQEAGFSYASFRRGRFLWVVFSKNLKLNFDFSYPISSLENSAVSIIKIAAPEGLAPKFLTRNDEITLSLVKGLSAKKPKINYAEGEFKANFATNISMVVSFIDPEVGDTLFVVVPKEQGTAVLDYDNYPLFELLPSSQGLAVAAKKDHLEMSVGERGRTLIIRE